MNKKINQAIKTGALTDFNQLFSGYSRKKQQKILQRAKYLQAAIAIKDLRKKLQLSQQKLAHKMKVKREFISRIETGQQNITLETLYRISAATGKEFHFNFK